ncbi:MAG: YjbH domain-containing protein [Pelagimonas sp.]|nr:YjbH domain-containing protein [Pelagimonas sp.]
MGHLVQGKDKRVWQRRMPPAALAFGLAALIASPATPQAGASAGAGDTIWHRPTLNFYGIPGILDMPTGHAMPDADLSLTLSVMDTTLRSNVHFQITPRLSGVFRYAALDDYTGNGTYYDRSFDLRYQIAFEGPYRPAIAIGLQDFGGTGIYAGEYLVASKTFGRLRATAGIGWGRFGSHNGFDNPLGVLASGLKNRPRQTPGVATTGRLDSSHWFRGDAALFGGLQYALNDRTVLSAEYSSDSYAAERATMGFQHNSPLNFGVTYRSRRGVDWRAAWLYGHTLGVQASYTFNPKTPTRTPGGAEAAPVPVKLRPAASARDLGWRTAPDSLQTLRGQVATVMAADGLQLDAMALTATEVRIRIRNPRYQQAAQAVGRTARILSNIMPDSVETFVIEPVSGNGVAAARITLSRSDLEELEYAPDGSWQSFARAQISDVPPSDVEMVWRKNRFPNFSFGYGPYVSASYFDPTSPVRLDFGIEASLRYEPKPGWVVFGRIKHRLTGDRGNLPETNSTIEQVRSNVGLYAETQTTLNQLTLAHYFRPGSDLYGRITAGFFEPMYGGLSTELLWKPVDNRLGLGIELNYAQARDYNQGLGFRDYGVLTGHASAYYDAPNGFQYQLDAGRYLAGDWGGTLSISREFGNGIRLGAFATLTTISFDDFGEGSFDKGLTLSIPTAALNGKPTKRRINRTVRPVQRDGGARIFVGGRLYEQIRSYQQPKLQEGWGKFWR